MPLDEGRLARWLMEQERFSTESAGLARADALRSLYEGERDAASFETEACHRARAEVYRDLWRMIFDGSFAVRSEAPFCPPPDLPPEPPDDAVRVPAGPDVPWTPLPVLPVVVEQLDDTVVF